MNTGSSRWMGLTDQYINRERSKDTGLAMVLIFLILDLFDPSQFYIKIALLLLFASLLVPIVFKPLAFVWFGLGKVIGKILSVVILSMVYLVVVTPIGLLRRAGGIDKMQRKRWRSGWDSVFIERNHQYSASDLEKPY